MHDKVCKSIQTYLSIQSMHDQNVEERQTRKGTVTWRPRVESLKTKRLKENSE